MGYLLANPLVFAGVLVLLAVISSIKIVTEYERLVVFRLGRLTGTRGPGISIVIVLIEKAVKVSLRLVTMDVPPQDIITKDNVSVKVNAVVYFRVMDPNKAIVEVEDYYYATSQLAQTTLRSVLGQVELDDLLSEREKINHELQEILDTQTDPWGVKVTTVEIKHVDLPQEMQRAMAKQAEAERERRAKVIAAAGEYQAANKLAEAADILSVNNQAIQLRYLQTLREIATENNSTTLFPIPMDLISGFMEIVKKKKEE
jgi:regulator of protease activity HflC (stomatin/prohibitin superfamily)